MGRQRLRRWLMKSCDADIKITPWDRNSWKWKAWSIGEQIGWEMWELTTRQYFRYSCCRLLVSEAMSVIPLKLPGALERRSDGKCWSSQPGSTSRQTAGRAGPYSCMRHCHTLCRYKWGLQKNRLPHTCKIEVDGPDGKKKLRQEPFETLAETYVPLTFVPGQNYTDPEAEQRRLHMF